MFELEEPIESAYFHWLCSKVSKAKIPTPSLSYFKLFREMQNTEFVWIVPLDDNRAEDGKELRREFLRLTGLQADREWFDIGCSVFEMIIAFTDRARFQTNQSAYDWFWQIMENLGLVKYNDAAFDLLEVKDILYILVWRTYDRHGNGGMFPIQNPLQDQQRIEIWYQFSEYLVEHELI